jgi:hypothetical protein
MVESMMRTSKPARRRGVEIASKPSGAVASMLEKEGMKNTIFLDGFTPAPPDVAREIAN